MTDDFEIVREALTHLLGRDDAGFPSEGFPSCIELYSEFSGTEVLAEARAALAALDRAEAERDRLREALRVYTSGHHRCDRRQCSCGAYTSLLAALSPENEETEG